MRITFDSAQLHLIGAMGEDQYIEMPQQQIVAIIGENKDTGGSNGSSKSTFTFASPLSLFGAKAIGKTNKELKNKKIKGSPRVVCKYTIDGKSLIVDRTIGGELKVTFDGQAITGSTDEVQARLEKIIGMTQEQFLQFSYKGQKTTEHFLKMNDSDKKSFLSSFFDVSKLEKMKEINDAKLSTTRKEKERTDGSIEPIKQHLEQCEKDFLNLKNNYDALTKQKRADLESNILLRDSGLKQLQELNSVPESLMLQADEEYVKKENAYLEMSKSAEQEKAFNAKAILDVIGLISIKKIPKRDDVAESIKEDINGLIVKKGQISVPQELMESLSQCTSLLKEQREGLVEVVKQDRWVITLQRDIESTKKIIEGIDKNPCPTCNRQFEDEHKEAQKATFITKIKDLEGSLDAALNALNLLKESFSQENVDLLMQTQAELNAEIKGYKENQTSEIDNKLSILRVELDSRVALKNMETESEIKKLQSDLNELTLTKNAIESNLSLAKLELDRAKDQVLSTHLAAKSKLTHTLEVLGNNIYQLETSMATDNSTLYSAQRTMERQKEQYEAARAKQEGLANEIIILEHSSFILSKNGFIGYLFDSILDELNTEINNNLKLVPVTSGFTLNFTPDKTAKTTGEVSKAITYEMTNNGAESGLGMTSGAEELVILLSVDEAVETVLSRRLGINIGWKFLDEQLYWVDGNSKEYVFEFYRQKAKDKAYYIIDHASEFNAAIDCTIRVVKENGVARIDL